MLPFTLTGCLPQDRIRALRFSPDSSRIAYLTDKKGLCIADMKEGSSRVLVRTGVAGDALAWSPAGDSITYVSQRGGSWNICVCDVDGWTTQVTTGPTRKSYPWYSSAPSIYRLDAANGKNELFRDRESSPVVSMRHDIVMPAASPQAEKFAFYTCSDLRPQVYLCDLATGRIDRLTSESNPLTITFSPLQWSPTGNKLLCVYNMDNAAGGNSRKRGSHPVKATGQRSASRHTSVIDVASEDWPSRGAIASSGLIEHACFVRDENAIAQLVDRAIQVVGPGRRYSSVAMNDLEPTLLQSSPNGGLGMVVEDQLLALLETTATRSRVLTFDLQDKFFLAETYFRKGATSRSYALYEELAASVQRTQDPALSKFVYAANLQRLGRTREAVQSIEQILGQREIPATVPRQYLWRALAFSHLLYLDDAQKAHDYLRRYRQAIGAQLSRTGSQSGDMALNALAIIERDNPQLTSKFAAAVRARLEGKVERTILLFGQLLAMAPEAAAVQREYLRALEGFDEDVFYFSPSQRPFTASSELKAKHLERFLKLTPESPLADSARLKLFLIYVESERFGAARELLSSELSETAEGTESVEGILEVFGNYLETAEIQPWLEAAMAEVFLHPQVRQKLTVRVKDIRIQFLIHLSAAKLALVQQRNDDARTELDGALAKWQQMEPTSRTYASNRFYARLICMRAREAETRNLFAEAAGYYKQALEHLEQSGADEFELFAEIRYRSELLRYALAHDLPLATEQLSIEKASGDELINPTWDEAKLTAAILRQVERFDVASIAQREDRQSIAAYESATLLRKIGRPWQARSGYRQALSQDAPLFVKQKSLLELAHLDEDSADPHYAAICFHQVAESLQPDDYLQPWLAYNFARLHLGLNQDRKAAREALAQIVNTRPGTPLSVQAQELLATTAD